MGGKSKISKDISEIINKNIKENQTFVSLFCGSCAIESKVNAKYKICNDLHTYLIELLKAIQDGYELPDTVTKELYDFVKNNKDLDKALTGFVGFGCSFGGRWFGGYAKNNSGTNYAKQSKNSLLKKMKNLQKDTTKFLNLSYDEVDIPTGSVVYCDPPYINTKKYSNTSNFDYDKFWDYMRTISKNNVVFISELNSPDDFIEIWSKSLKRVLDVNKNNIFKSNEKLFVHISLKNKIHI